MSLLVSVIIVIIVIGLLIWLIERYAPLPEPFKGILIILLVVLAIFWLLTRAGII